MSDTRPSDQKQKRETLLNTVDKIAPVLRASGATSEELGTLSPKRSLRCVQRVSSSSSFARKWAAPKPTL